MAQSGVTSCAASHLPGFAIHINGNYDQTQHQPTARHSDDPGIRERGANGPASAATLRKLFWVNLVLTVIAFGALDLAAFQYLPERFVYLFPEYKQSPASGVADRARHLNDYFRADAGRGFDISEFADGMHSVDGLVYPVWSNSLGCFDVEHWNLGEYVYFAGDSFTWGYSPFEEKFGTLVERSLGTEILKCGVTHTGQRHQYNKFLEIVDRVERLPKAVFVFHYPNDLVNDFAHPHSTVLDGWQVNTVGITQELEIIHHSDEELRTELTQRLQKLDGNEPRCRAG
jgi:hypothetical protein